MSCLIDREGLHTVVKLLCEAPPTPLKVLGQAVRQGLGVIDGGIGEVQSE